MTTEQTPSADAGHFIWPRAECLVKKYLICRKSGLHPEYMMQGCFRTWFKQTLVCLHRFGSFEVGRRESCQPDIVVLHDVRIKCKYPRNVWEQACDFLHESKTKRIQLNPVKSHPLILRCQGIDWYTFICVVVCVVCVSPLECGCISYSPVIQKQMLR